MNTVFWILISVSVLIIGLVCTVFFSAVHFFRLKTLRKPTATLENNKENSIITHQQINDSDTTIETSSENDEMPHNNAIATAIRVIAVLTYICGFIAGIIFAANQPSFSSLYGSHSNQFSWVVAFIWWGASFISGTFILGFSEIIKLLNDIKNKK